MVSLAGLQLEEDIASRHLIADALGTIGGSAPTAADVDNGDTASCPDVDESRPITVSTSIRLQSASSSKFKREFHNVLPAKCLQPLTSIFSGPAHRKRRKIAAK